jgi:S-adenosylmethionine-dependent methyltransferase
MKTTPVTFDASISRWADEQRTPWSQLKYIVTQANLRRHLEPGPLRILDAGGGNGFDSIPLARDGHSVAIVDYSAAMLADVARNTTDRITTHAADIMNLPQIFPEPSFDVVLCHNVLQYVDDVPALLAAIVAPLKAGGLVSLISVNRYAIPYRAAFFRGDLAEAYAKLDQRSEVATIFGMTMNEYTGEEISAMLSQVGCAVDKYYGIRCICDYWGDNDRKSDPAIFAQLQELELALTDRHPYNLLARYFQIVAHKLD